MKRFLALALTLSMAAAALVVTPGSAATMPETAAGGPINVEKSQTTGDGCCWVYFWGMWWCTACE